MSARIRLVGLAALLLFALALASLALFAPPALGQQVKISQLPPEPAVAPTDLLPIVQGGTTYNTTVNALALWYTANALPTALGAPRPIGAVAPNTGAFTTLSATAFTVNGIPPITRITAQLLPTNVVYTPNPNLVYAIIECRGGGGGSGGLKGQGSAATGAGGRGGYTKAVVTAAQIGSSAIVIIGAGGTGGTNTGGTGSAGGPTFVTGFAGLNLCTANGGGGSVGVVSTTGTFAGGVAATAGSTGGQALDIEGGSDGEPGITLSSSSVIGGTSADGAGSINGSPCVNGRIPGGGASGMSTLSGTPAAGCTGGNGLVSITEFDSQ